MAGKELKRVMLVVSEKDYRQVMDTLINQENGLFSEVVAVMAERWDGPAFNRALLTDAPDGVMVDASFFGMVAALDMAANKHKPVVGVFLAEETEINANVIRGMLRNVPIVVRRKNQDMGEIVRQAGEELKAQYRKMNN